MKKKTILNAQFFQAKKLKYSNSKYLLNLFKIENFYFFPKYLCNMIYLIGTTEKKNINNKINFIVWIKFLFEYSNLH